MKPTEDDIIGTPPRRDAFGDLPLFTDLEPDAAAAALRAQFVAPPPPPPTRPAPPAAEEPDGRRHPFLRSREDDRLEGIETIKAKILPSLLERAALRVNRWENPGVTADDVTELARELPQAALLGAQQRAWSWVGPWLAQVARAGQLAELVRGGQVVRRRSTRPGAHGNLQIVYVHPTDQDAAPRQGAA